MKSNSLHVVMLSRLGRNEGGRETWLYNFLPRLVLRDEGIAAVVFGVQDHECTSARDELQSQLAGCSIARLSSHQFIVHKRRYPVFFQMWKGMLCHTWSRKFKPPDVVVAMGIFELAMILTGRYTGSKKIVWLRSIFLHEKANRFPPFLFPVLRWLELAMLRRVQLVMANGEDIAEHYRAHGLAVHVIENGVDFERWSCESAPLSLPLDVAFIGRLAEVKGIDEFIDLVRLVKTGGQADSFRFHVVGAGPYSDNYKFGEAACMFEYHGTVSNTELPSWLARFDVCVALTKAGESGGGGGTSNALLEQLAAGKVILAWNNAIFRQVVNDECAYLVPQGDVNALAQALYTIASSRPRATSKSTMAKQIVQKYSLNSQVDRFLELMGRSFH